ncbi:MAG: DnaA ATPase domain-containing protein, partial [Bacteroidales bacterium]
MIDVEWDRIKGRLRDEVGDAAYRSWLRPITLQDARDGAVRLGLPTRFMRDWVATHYGERIKSLWGAENPAIRSVEIVVGNAPRVMPAANAAAPAAVTAAPVAAAPASVAAEPRAAAPCGPADVDELGAQLDTRYTFKNFVVGKPNEFAYAAARRVAEADAVSFNPLFLYGGVGLGKTHLMHAIAWHIREHNPTRRVLYLSAEKFMYRFIRALRSQDTMSFKEQFRSVDVLMVDDVQFIAGKDATQEEFFHTFNA